MDASLELVRRIRPVLLNLNEQDHFWACYTEDVRLAQHLAGAHPTLVIYTISSWGNENWVHRGLRIVNRMGYLFGTEDLGDDYAELLWIDHDESTE
jgi:hypothetical protein